MTGPSPLCCVFCGQALRPRPSQSGKLYCPSCEADGGAARHAAPPQRALSTEPPAPSPSPVGHQPQVRGAGQLALVIGGTALAVILCLTGLLIAMNLGNPSGETK